MGGHMAHNLLKKQHPVVVFDVAPAAVELAESRGAVAASNPAELASQVDAIVAMLPSAAHVRQVFEGAEGVFEGLKAHAGPGDVVIIDSSTIDPVTAESVSDQAQTLFGAHMVDAPVSGGVGGAEAGTLTFMVGGTDEAFNAAEPVLSAMGSNLVHCGKAGAGQVAKICNNLVLAISMVGVSEGMNLGAKLGMDPKKLAGIFNTSTARCWSSDTYNPCPGVMDGVPASRGYTGGFGVDLMKKDLGLAMEAGVVARQSLPMGSLAHQLYTLHSSNGQGGKDFSSIYKMLEGGDYDE